MKAKVTLALVCLVVGFASALLLVPSTVPVSLADCGDDPCANPPCCNGDVNGSGAIDIADAVYLLSYLFAQGPESKAITCPVPSGGALPATGQTECYGYDPSQGYIAVPCEGAEFPGQDAAYEAGCPMAGRFTDNGDGTVTDNCTGLTWQKNTADINGDGMIRGTQDSVTWEQALQYCEGLDFAGHADWRLPNERELQSIADYGRIDPAIDPIFGAVSESYRSSSSLVSNAGQTWLVNFRYGGVGFDARSSHLYVRAVRGGL